MLHALIINEQHLIQQPVIEALFFKKKIFQTIDYILQERLHFSVVLFPTLNGEIYGRTIKDFSKVEKRIELGIHLSWILLHSSVSNSILDFFYKSCFTGSRIDYQQYQSGLFYRTPPLLEVYPFIYHRDEKRNDWSKEIQFSPSNLLQKCWKPPQNFILTQWYKKKQKQVVLAASFYRLIQTVDHDHRE